jgi:outer membrane lipoprotein-sorting protein
MSLLAEHPRARWLAPTAAVALVAGASLAASRASADPTLPPRSAQQLLTDVQKAQLTGLSGTVVQSANLGLPDLPGLSTGPGGGSGGSSDLSSMLSGTHTLRVWYGGERQVRLALVGSLGESDVIRNGSDLWVWSSRDKTAEHRTLAANAESGVPEPAPTQLPTTPEGAADLALSRLEPTTAVTTDGTATVAGRPAYELVLTPKSTTTLVRQVRIAVDATEHIPLRVQVYSTKLATPAVEVGFSQVDFARPEARQFAFNPPPGTTVKEGGTLSRPPTPHGAPSAAPAVKPKVVGTGWNAVLVTTLPKGATSSGASSEGSAGGSIQGMLRSLPAVSGSWGSGRLLSGTLFSAVVADDGRVAVGAVPPAQLYAALTAS